MEMHTPKHSHMSHIWLIKKTMQRYSSGYIDSDSCSVQYFTLKALQVNKIPSKLIYMNTNIILTLIFFCPTSKKS